MSTLRWRGPGTFTDHANDVRARPESEHEFSDEQADAYLNHPLFGDRWERVDDEGVSASADTDTTAANDEPNPPDGKLTDIDGVGPATADDLREAGYEDLDGLRGASKEELTAVDGVSDSLAETIVGTLNE